MLASKRSSQHYENAIQALVEKKDEDGAERLRRKLDDIDQAIKTVDYRAANIRAGYVYIISNVGSFGERMVKVGLTRRLEPMDRIRELSDSSVPFNFDVHALFFSQDAVGVEASLHERLARLRVNIVNPRREFFYATPLEVKAHLLELKAQQGELALAGEMLEFHEVPEAIEYRQSMRAHAGSNPSTAPISVTQH